MSAAEETIERRPAVKPKIPAMNRALDFLSSVRFGVIQLCALVVLAMLGMLIVQQEVDPGFDSYYASLTPAEKLVFESLDFFNIYHSWYFNLLLLSLSLNIVLASIDRFPSSWSYLVKPKLKATKKWLLAKKDNETFEFANKTPEDVAGVVGDALRENGYKPLVTQDGSATMVFGERGRTNRLGAYVVHIFLLTLFLGYFVALQTGFTADVRMIPGSKTDEIQMIEYNLDKKERFNVKLPFTLECTDIQQNLINENGSIDVTNTLDWRTQVKIDDPSYGVSVDDISLNKPLDYRGYRFFQSQTIPIGNARTITLELTPQAGGDPLHVSIPRNGSSTLADGTTVQFEDFEPDFSFGADGKPDTKSGDYNNPVAILNVTPPGGARTRIFAFAQKLPDNAPVGAPKLGYKWRLAEFEKSPLAHVLSIKYDPYKAIFIAWYIGGFGLVGALILVFFRSHKRFWARIETREDGTVEAVLAGEANRNRLGFSDKFNKVVDNVRRRKE